MKIERHIAVFAGIFGLMTVIALCDNAGMKKDKKDAGGDIVVQGKGSVLVALLGMPGCPGTEAATKFLSEYSRAKKESVKVCRIDVPLPGKTLEPAGNINAGFDYTVDSDRTIADRLEFFFYPTLYIFDRDGVVRFSGGCEPDKVKTMVAELVAEVPGTPKKMYTQPMVKTGDVVEDFSISDSEGNSVALSDLCGEAGVILFFSSTTCPFSMEAADDLDRLKKDYAADKLTYAVVSFGQPADKVRGVYSQKTPDCRLVVDADCSISKKYFGVTAVPSFCLLDKDRKVLGRGPFVYDTVKAFVANAPDQGDGRSGAAGAG